MHEDIQRILVREEEIHAGLRRLAEEVTAAFGAGPLTVVSVLKGSCIFCADLIREIPIPLELAFCSARSYGDDTVAGDLELVFPDAGEIAGRRVLLVDDILDTGRTLSSVRAELVRQGALEVRTCVLLDKPARRRVSFRADHVGFEVEDVFVVGYGLDYAGRYRNLRYIGCLKDEAVTVGTP